MRFLSLGTCVLALVHAIHASAVPSCPDGLCLETRAHITVNQIGAELGRMLSKAAQIFGPDDARWANATERFQTYKPPNITVVVEPGAEADIATIVCHYPDLNIQVTANPG
jgi:hypothetical protein